MSEEKDLMGENAEDFATLLSEHEAVRNTLKTGQKISGNVITITKDSVFIDLGIKQDGIMDRDEILDADGNETIAQGDAIEAWVVGLSPQGPRLSKAMIGSGEAALEEAKDAGIPVEGRVTGSCKGGYQVEIMGKKAFCPGSQMENLAGRKEDELAGQTMQFLVTRVENHGRNVVVSRRALIERERQESIDNLLSKINIGDILDGKIKRLAQFGVFIEIAPSVEGMAHISELSFSRLDNPADIFAVGDDVRAKLISMEKDNKGNLRLGLSIKQAMDDPWLKAGEKFLAGEIYPGKVVRLAPFGAFVELSPGIEGLVHISELSWEKRVNKPEDVLSIGDAVNVKIKDIDSDARRLSLSLRDALGDPWADAENRFTPGSVIKGKLESRSQMGLFINIAPGITGLLSQHAIKESREQSKLAKLGEGEEVSVTIQSIDPAARRVSLLPASGVQAEKDVSWREHTKSTTSESNAGFGIMAQALQKALGNKHQEK